MEKTFTLHVSERSPFSDGSAIKDLSDFDESRRYYNCDIFFDGKAKALRSPIFKRDSEYEKFRAYSILRDIISETITRTLLPTEECPQYKRINGVLTPCNINDNNQQAQ